MLQYLLIQMNKSIYGVNSLVSLTERILTKGKTNELSKYRERFIWIEKRVYFQYLPIFFKNF